MKLKQNGKYILLEFEEDYNEMMSIRCACGRTLAEHEFHFTYGSRMTIETTYGKTNKCGQFKLKGRIETKHEAFAKTF